MKDKSYKRRLVVYFDWLRRGMFLRELRSVMLPKGLSV